tara:strand:- start:17092 stop:18438 length:1347 start_codon:yes stop_codon:yes gene_type:complete
MKNNQINFFKSRDFNTIVKPLAEDLKTFREERIVKIENYEVKKSEKELEIGIFGWYAICPTNELKKNKLFYFSMFDEPLILFRDEKNFIRCVKNVCPHRGASFYEGDFINGELTCPYHGAKFNSEGSCQNVDRLTCSHIVDSNYKSYAKKIHLYQYKTLVKDDYIFINYSESPETNLNDTSDELPINNHELNRHGFKIEEYVSEEVLVDFKCDWARIIENHLDILHIFWVHGDTIPDKDVNKNVLTSFNQKININNEFIESIYSYKNEPSKEFIRIKFIPPGRILIYKGDPKVSRYLQVLDHIPLGNNKARVIVRHYRKFMKNKLLRDLVLFEEIQRKTFYKIFNEDYMILKTQTYNLKLELLKNDEIKLLGEDKIIKYYWNWYKKSEQKDNPWRYSEKIENNMDVYDKLIFKYPPEINKLDILNNLKIIRKTLIRYGSPLLIFLLLI